MVICHGACKVHQSPRQITSRRSLDITKLCHLAPHIYCSCFLPSERSARRASSATGMRRITVAPVARWYFYKCHAFGIPVEGDVMRLRRSYLFHPPPDVRYVICLRLLCLPPSWPAHVVLNHLYSPSHYPQFRCSRLPRWGSQFRTPMTHLV